MKPGKKRWVHLRFHKKIRNILLAYYLTPVLLILFASGGFFYYFAKQSLDTELGNRLMSVALSSAYQIYPFQISALELRDSENLTNRTLLKRLEKIRADNQMSKVFVFNLNDQSLLDTDAKTQLGSTYERNRSYRVEIDQAKNGKPTTSTLFQGDDGNYYKSAFAPILDETGKAIAYVGVNGNATFFRNLHLLSRRLILFGLLATCIIAMVSVFISRKIVVPIQHLVASAERMGAGQFEDPIEIRAQHEIGFLGLVMDEMRKSIIARDRELQTMLHGIAHEVRNPLGGIELFAGMLEEEVKDPESKTAVEKIQKEVRILKNLVEEFLDFARKSPLQITKVQLKPFFQDVRVAFQKELVERKIDFQVATEGVEETEFDPDQMRRVFLNLVRNGIQALPSGGKIELKAARQNGNIELVVSDNGVGIPKESLEKVFDPFYTTKERGTGLGLSFASKIVNAHGGEIRVESEIQKGTKVSVTLPA